MNRNELIVAISEKAELTKSQAESIMKAVLQAITTTIKQHGKMIVNGLGTFTATPRAARRGRNPQTGEEIVISATVVPGFKPAPLLKALLNEEAKEEVPV